MVKKKFLYWFIYLVLGVFLLDTLTKTIALQKKPDFYLIPNFLGLHFTTNTGISFGMLKAYPFIPLIVSILVLIGIIYYFKQIPSNGFAQIGVALIFAGTAGNLTDRLLHGFVIDFIDFAYWPAFNLADTAITIGAILLIIYLIKN